MTKNECKKPKVHILQTISDYELNLALTHKIKYWFQCGNTAEAAI